MKQIFFKINYPGEVGAGINGFTDEVIVTIVSGDPGGEPGDFEKHMVDALADWYDTSKVTLA